ncbi:MAG: hypothetical protein KJZ78_01920 [Bryobacteraceae bacterium]|nr:hypothetical protein [Bryobacteraceae bacterium]
MGLGSPDGDFRTLKQASVHEKIMDTSVIDTPKYQSGKDGLEMTLTLKRQPCSPATFAGGRFSPSPE